MNSRTLTNTSATFALAALAILLFASLSPAPTIAATLYWDATPGTPDGASQGGTGTWDTATANWDDGGAYQVWNNANNDTAVFAGTAGTVMLGANITVGGLQFDTNGYAVNTDVGTTLTFGTAGSINVSTGTTTISPVVAGSGSSAIEKTGGGTLILRGDNTYTGDTTISGGRLQLGGNNDSGTLGAGSYAGAISIAGGAQLFFNNNSAQTLSGVISGDGGLQKAGGNVLVLSGNNTYTGKTIVAGAGRGGPQLSVSSFNSVVGGTASSSLGAPTSVANGTIEVGSSGNFRNSTLIYTGSGETTDRVINVRFNASAKHTLTANGTGLLKFTSPFVVTRSSGNINGGFTLRGTGEGEITGDIGNATTQSLPGFFNKDDAGTWTLGGAITADRSTIDEGTLNINGALSVTNTVTVNSAGTLGGTGTIGGNTTISGTLSPGTSPGTLTFADDLTLNNGSTYAFEAGDLTDVQGALALNDNWTLALGGGLADGGSVTVFTYGLLAGGADLVPTFDISNLGFAPSGPLSLSNSGGAIVLNGVSIAVPTVPEPSTAILVALGLVGLVGARRRRRS